MPETIDSAKVESNDSLQFVIRAYPLSEINKAGFTIKSPEEMREANLILNTIKERMDRVDAFWEEPLRKTREAYKVITNMKKVMVDWLQEREVLVKKSMLDYQATGGEVEGAQVRKKWTFKIVDETKIPRSFLCADQKKLGELAEQMQALARVDGVEFFYNSSIAAEARRK